jgi:hypothetical protein
VPDLDPQINYTNGQSIFLNAPTNVVVHFVQVPYFLQPVDFTVRMQPGQDAILDMAYVSDLVLSASAERGVQAAGVVGARIQIQYRESLAMGSWTNLNDRIIILTNSAPATVITPDETKLKPGFYRAVFLP